MRKDNVFGSSPLLDGHFFGKHSKEIYLASKKMKNLLAVLLLLSASCTQIVKAPEEKTPEQLAVDTINIKLDLLLMRVEQAEKHMTLQDSIIKTLALHASYADSLTMDKQRKNDRAERRGKFLGSLLKTLIPGL